MASKPRCWSRRGWKERGVLFGRAESRSRYRFHGERRSLTGGFRALVECVRVPSEFVG